MFSQIGTMFVAYGKRIVAVCCVLMSVTFAYAGSDKYANVVANIHPKSTGSGTVYAKGSAQEQSTNKIGVSAQGIGVENGSGSQNVDITLTASANARRWKKMPAFWAGKSCTSTICAWRKPPEGSISEALSTAIRWIGRSSGASTISPSGYGIFPAAPRISTGIWE